MVGWTRIVQVDSELADIHSGELCEISAASTAASTASGRLSSAIVAEVTLSQTGEIDPSLNEFAVLERIVVGGPATCPKRRWYGRKFCNPLMGVARKRMLCFSELTISMVVQLRATLVRKVMDI